MQQQQQQPASYDLLAVFPDESKAEAAADKLHREGFTENEVYQLANGSVGSGQFREHGPNAGRREIFLQTQNTGPNPFIVVLLAVVCGLILTGLTFALTFAMPTLPEPTTLLIGTAIGLVLGTIIGLLQRGRVRGDIGQQRSAQPAPVPRTPSQEALLVVALRFADPENISRTSRARAILLNNQGKIDRSVGRRE